ncbi:MAG TPA: prolyl oligopeptidase family serine peptidase [Vicinamibacterales bacterium]|nr:prolyl oligopeptidase family serine peptidase [Vicinamibacterales bacterium]
MSFPYPPARADGPVEILHGVPVSDPYRWLEDPDSLDTRAWVEAQNTLTRATLDGPRRDALVRELTALFDYPRTSALLRRGGWYFFTHNHGSLNQPQLLVRDASGQPKVLLDPNRLSEDGTTALTAVSPSPDGSLVAYALSEHGSDRQVIRVRDTRTGADRDDALRHVKFASIAWTPDAAGFYYLRFPDAGSVPAEDAQYFGRICFHRLGDPQGADRLVFETPGQKEVVPMVHVTADGRWAVIVAQRGASDDSEIHLADRAAGGALRPVFTGFDAAYDFIEGAGGRLFFRTTKDAPLGRIVSIDPDDLAAGLREVVAESADRLSSAVMARGTLVATSLRNASDRLLLFALDGSPQGEIPLPGIGTIVAIDATPDDDEVRFVFTSFTQPPAGYTFRLAAFAEASAPKNAEATEVFVQSRGFRLEAEDYETTQVWYPSKDGTRVSMFLVHRAGIARDGNRPVLLSGYGGFNISRTPAFDPGNFPFLDGGGVFALANLRGGGEYGETWHRAGMLERKQNVFDDFMAAAEFLIAAGYTAPGRIAIEGGSNGGLLVGAVMTQRPELFGAVICRVPVADMLRYHLFTVGRFWIPEYGSADDPSQFPFLLQYSPYHNVRPGVRYPPTLVMTADTDDRVDPGMAKKFAARLQAAGGGGPILIRVETKAGHGAGKPLAKVIEEEADILAFLALQDGGGEVLG